MSDLKSKLAILRQIADEEDVPIPDDVSQYLAEATSSGRTLERLAMRLVGYATLECEPISLQLAIRLVRESPPWTVH